MFFLHHRARICTTYHIFPVNLFLLFGNCFLEAMTLKHEKKNNLWPWLEVGLCLGGGSWTQGFWYFAEKKAKFRGIFRGKFAEKSADFAGKKSKFAEKSADFAGFLREKSQNSQKNWPILAEKSQILKDFRGKFLEKIGWFHGKFRGKLSQETISKKQPISLDFFWQISLKSINFASIWPALVNVFFNRDNHLLFPQQFAREMSEC